MNEELQKALSELLNKANNSIDAAGNFVGAELPDVMQQLLNYAMIKHALLLGLFFIVFSGFVALSITGIRKNWNDGVGFCIGASLISLMPCVLSFIGLLKIWIAPKVWLLEYAANLTN